MKRFNLDDFRTTNQTASADKARRRTRPTDVAAKTPPSMDVDRDSGQIRRPVARKAPEVTTASEESPPKRSSPVLDRTSEPRAARRPVARPRSVPVPEPEVARPESSAPRSVRVPPVIQQESASRPVTHVTHDDKPAPRRATSSGQSYPAGFPNARASSDSAPPSAAKIEDSRTRPNPPTYLSDTSEPRAAAQPMRPAAARGPGVFSVRNPHSAKTEALRKIVSRLLLNGRGKKIDPIAICSVASGDGRSFVAANLAVLFAQAGKRTLLIDADFRHADQHRVFNIQAAPGLAELLRGESDWGAIKPIEEIPELYVLPFGQHSGDPLELLASDVFVDVFNRLVDICDVVLIDTPAGDRYVDAQVVAAQVGAAMLVIKQDSTTLSSARELKQALTRAGANVLGAVINRG